MYKICIYLLTASAPKVYFLTVIVYYLSLVIETELNFVCYLEMIESVRVKNNIKATGKRQVKWKGLL